MTPWKMKPGQFYQTKDGLVEVLECVSKEEILIEFVEYKSTKIVHSGNLRKGNVRNRNKPSVYGVGIIGDGQYNPYYNHTSTPAYVAWNGMLCRTQKPKTTNEIRNYSDVTIEFEWFYFQKFAEWYYKQTNKFGNVDFKWELDKDFKIPGNRTYGPNVCYVLPKAINSLLIDCYHSRGKYPLGVHRQGSYFRTATSQDGKKKLIGTYPTVADAQRAYWSEKFRVIQETTIRYWQYLPEPLAWRLLTFDWPDAHAYYGDDAAIRL